MLHASIPIYPEGLSHAFSVIVSSLLADVGLGGYGFTQLVFGSAKTQMGPCV
jgi:hypothetical protein